MSEKTKLLEREVEDQLQVKFRQIDQISYTDESKSAFIRVFYNAPYEGITNATPSHRNISRLISYSHEQK